MSPKGRPDQSASVRDQVLDSALRLASEHGFDSVTLQKVAADCGMSKAGVLHHFPSLEKLMLATLQRRDEEIEDDYRSGLPYLEVIARLREENSANVGVMATFTAMVALASTDTEETTRRAFFRERYRYLHRFLAERIASELQPELSRPSGSGYPDSLASLMIAVMDGLQVQQLLGLDEASTEGAYRLITQMIDPGATITPPPAS